MEPQEDKSISIIAYFGPIGFVISILMFNSNKNINSEYNKFHRRQSLGLNIVIIAAYIIFNFLGNYFYRFNYYIPSLTSLAIYIIAIYLYVTGIINASKGKTEYLPIAGDKFELIGKKFIK